MAGLRPFLVPPKKTGKKDELLGIGIRNSIDRLRLIYQNDASLYFYNAADGGAIVEIRIRSKEGM